MHDPRRPLSPIARRVWRLQQLGVWAVLCVAGVILTINLDVLGPLFWIVPAIGLVLCTTLVPPLLYSRWRWDVRDEGIDIRHGAITIRRTLVPWVRVQHVDTRRGLFEQGFGLATVVVHTAAGSHTIPLLPQTEAETLRERIAGLARTEDAEREGAAVPAADDPAPPAPAATDPAVPEPAAADPADPAPPTATDPAPPTAADPTPRGPSPLPPVPPRDDA